MRLILYTLAWCCIFGGCVFAGVADISRTFHILSVGLLIGGAVLGLAGYLVTRSTTKACPYCRERIARKHRSCEYCSTVVPSERADLTS